MARIQSICTSDWGTPIEATARNVAGFLALIYTAGFVFGQWLHNLNDWLAGKPEHVASAVIQNDAPVSDDIEAIADLVFSDRPGVDREAAVILHLNSLTVQKLRTVARRIGLSRDFYRMARKAELIEELSYVATTHQLTDLEVALGI